MRISARNQMPATVRTVTEGGVMAEVVAVITAESARRLGLLPGRRVMVVVKSTEVMLAVDD